MKLNTPAPVIYTHEGMVATHISPFAQLRRSVCSCLLWEKEFYEDGQEIAKRIAALVDQCDPGDVSSLAIAARANYKLRHVPLLLCRSLATRGKLSSETLASVIQRPDELSEFLAIYWKDRKQPLSSQVKKGLASAFTKFNVYSLAKYNRDGAIKLRDVLFLCHARPKDEEQAKVWKQLVDGTLPTPDTWEVAISACKTAEDKKWAWARLLSESKLGALALLRNLRNMKEAGVDAKLVSDKLRTMKTDRVLPFRFVAAARHAPGLEADLEQAMFRCLTGTKMLEGKTTLLVDVSGSMEAQLSGRSEMTRMDAACGLAVLLRQLCDYLDVYTFSNKLVAVPARRGFALRDAITESQDSGGTYLGEALTALYGTSDDKGRLIIITDEQAHPGTIRDGSGYVINVASAKNGIGYGRFVHIDGFSEAVVDFIQEHERQTAIELEPADGA